jgi:hypothetical protein
MMIIDNLFIKLNNYKELQYKEIAYNLQNC